MNNCISKDFFDVDANNTYKTCNADTYIYCIVEEIYIIQYVKYSKIIY